MVKFKFQQHPCSCGIACLNYVLQLHDYKFQEKDLYSMCEFKNGMTDVKIVKILQKFKIRGVKTVIKKNKLIEYLTDRNRLLHFVTTWCKTDKCWHYVLVHGVLGNIIFYLEPDSDAALTVKTSMNFSDFLDYVKADKVEVITIV